MKTREQLLEEAAERMKLDELSTVTRDDAEFVVGPILDLLDEARAENAKLHDDCMMTSVRKGEAEEERDALMTAVRMLHPLFRDELGDHCSSHSAYAETCNVCLSVAALDATAHLVAPEPQVATEFDCDHEARCCKEHGTHSIPHVGCILR